METVDFLVIGGGVAGLSAAHRLATHGAVAVLEAEQAIGFHSSGRSATFAHYGIGDSIVRAMTSFSRGFFTNPPDGFTGDSLAKASAALFVGTREMQDTLDALEGAMGRYSDAISRVDEAEMLTLCPILRCGPDAIVAGVLDGRGLRLDSNALLQGYARAIRLSGGTVRLDSRVTRIDRAGRDWVAESPDGRRWRAKVLVNAGGAWADRIAELAGVRPLGLRPLRRTIIVIDPPEGMDARGWPFVKSAADAFYMLPESGRLMASPVDEEPDEPCDAQPEEIGVALAAHRVEEFTTLSVRRIVHRWAGLRTFAKDRAPVVGFAADAPGFLWLAGQGGYGLQTAPAMAAAAESVVVGGEWPAGLRALGVTPAELSPERLMS